MTPERQIEIFVESAMRNVISLMMDEVTMLDAVAALRYEIIREVAFRKRIKQSKELMNYE